MCWGRCLFIQKQLNSSVDQRPPLGGEAVFLQAAVGFFRKGHLNQVLGEQAFDLFMQFARNGFVSEMGREGGFAGWAVAQGYEDLSRKG